MGGEGSSISTISTIIPSVPAWAGVGFSNQFHFHSSRYSGTADRLPVGSLSSCPCFGLGLYRGERKRDWVLVDVFANCLKFHEALWNSSEASQVPDAFILVRRIWTMVCRDGAKSFGTADEQSVYAVISSSQSSPVQWAVWATVRNPQPDGCSWILLLQPQKTYQDMLSSLLCGCNMFCEYLNQGIQILFWGGVGWWGSWILKQCFSLKAIPLHSHLHIDYCWTGQAVSKCIFKLLSNFSVPLAAYGWKQWKWSGRVLLLHSENLKMS